MIHPAHKYTFSQLYKGLEDQITKGLVTRKEKGPLCLYTYTQKCVFEKAWNPFTLMSRGLILDKSIQMVVATPLVKFFNLNEMSSEIPNEPFTIFEKIDGSLIIAFFSEGKWHCATKGSFDSDQAKYAEKFLQDHPVDMDECYTYLFELVCPENRIVVNYGKQKALYVLGAYGEYGEEHLPLDYKFPFAGFTGRTEYPLCPTHSHSSIEELVTISQTLSKNNEGFVVRFENGYRIKIKGEEYIRLHRIKSQITPLGIWDMMRNGDDLDIIRREIDEEMLVDFDEIRTRLSLQALSKLSAAKNHCMFCLLLDRKDFAMMVQRNVPQELRSICFMLYDSKSESEIKKAIFKQIRPTNNILVGYKPSMIINRFISEGM